MPVRPRKAVQSGDDGSEDEESQRCPICLNFPKSSECAVPDVCNHIYCLSCILRWSQTLQICPVDRRPFSSIFKQDPVLGCIKIPVQTSSISWSCEDGKTAESFSKEEKTKVEENGNKRANATLKCKICETDSSALKKKKVKGQTCGSQLLTQHVPRGLSAEQGKTLGTLNQVITETVVITEEETIDKDWRARQRNMIDHQWLPVSIPSPSTYMPSILSRQCVRTQALFLQPVPSTSPCSLVSGFPALFGKVCAVMCPKGEGRKGTRGSGSKGPSKQAESLKTTRSTRSRKSTSVSEEPLSQQSGSSSSAGSDSNDMAASTSKQRLTGKQKPTAKRKGRTKKAATRRAVVESEEEGDDKRDENELTDEKKSKDDPEANVEEVQEAETCEETQSNQSSCPGDVSADVDLGSDSDVQDGENQQMDVNDLQNVEESEESESEVEPNDNQTSPQEDHVEEEEPEGQPAVSPERDHQPSVSSADQVTIEECSENSSSIMSPPQEDLSTATESLLEKETDPKPEPDPKLETDPKPEPEVQPEPLNCGNVTEDICKSSILDSIPPAITVEDCLPKDQDPLAAAETMQEESLDISNHQDNTEAIPMDCDSPGSDNNSHVGEIILENNNAVPGSQITSADPTPSQEGQQQNQVTEHKTETSEEPKSTGRADGRQRKSRFHSPTTTWSPKSESRREGSRRSRSRDRSRNASSPHRSRGSEREEDQGSSRWNRSRERWSRRRSRSRSRNRSRSRSRSRNRSYRRSLSSERNDQGAHSPRRRDSRGGEGWRGANSSRSSNWRNNSERQGQFPARDSVFSTNGSLCPPETSPDRGQTENLHWVNERSRINADGREREQHFEDKSGDGADSWSRRGRGFEQGRAAGHGRGGMCPPGQYGESAGSWRQQQRNSFSGTTNNTVSDSYSHFNENRNGGKRKELEINESPLDRSGWSAASSWAVRRTLPADVQNYYSRRDRGPGPGGSIWNRPEEEQPAAGVSRQTDLPQSEPNTHIPNEAVPAPPSVLPPQLNMLGVLRYPLGPMGPPGPPGPPVSIHPVPFTMPTPIPVHLHPPPPPIQVPAMGMQALPPPPPPPPPVQQGSLTILPADTHPQMIASVPVPGKAQVRASPSKATPSQSLPASTPSVAQPSSTTQPSSHSKAHADSSKKEKKLHIQEKAIAEVKAAIKPYYQKKDITKEEYKEIVRKAVEKVCHSKSGEVNASKVANLVKAYVDKYKHVRKNKTDKN